MYRAKSRDVLLIVLGCSVLLLALFPFWIFGKYSALGWYDEADGVIPWYVARSRVAAGGFVHNFVGGTGSGGFFLANEKVSLYRFLFQHFDLWIANLIMRVGGMWFLFAGLYFFLRRVVGAMSGYLSLAASLFAILVSYIQYGWVLGGMGWDFGVVAWLMALLFSKNVAVYWALPLSAVASVVSMPVFLLPYLVYMFFFCLFLFSIGRIQKSEIKRVALVAVLFLIPFLANWVDGFSFAIFDVKSFSSRIHGTLSPVVFSGKGFFRHLVFLIREEVYGVKYLFARFPHPFLFIAYGLALIQIINRNWKRTFLFLFMAYPLPVLLDISCKLSGISFLQAYRWTNLHTLQSMMCALYLVQECRHLRDKTAERFVATALLVGALLGGASLVRYTLLNFKSYEGFEELADLGRKAQEYRAISGGELGTIPALYGIATFDGSLQNSPMRRNYFIAYGVYDPPIETLHTHRHFFYDFPKGLDLKLFELANVRYVLSDKNLNVSFPLVSKREELFYSGFKVRSPLYIYEMTGAWPRFFGGQSLKVSQFNYRRKEFYRELKTLQPGGVLVASEDKPRNFSHSSQPLSVLGFSLRDGGADVRITGTGGLLVFNQVYTPQWSARCGLQPLEVVPVNGVMMATLVPPGCTEMAFVFGRTP